MKITTVVPAYKPKYLADLLHALLRQTVRPHQVIFSDDSPEQDFVRLLKSGPLAELASGLDIEVVEGPRRGAFANWRHSLETFGGRTEFFHMLCDDDVMYPSFYERHLQAHAHGNFGVTVSRRWTADEAGQPIRDLPVPASVANGAGSLVSLDASVLFYATCARGTNWLGEVSNALYRADAARLISDPQVGGIGYLGLEDIGSFLCSTLTRPVCYINDHLGFFRTSSGQNSAQHYGRPLKLAFLAYLALSMIGRNAGHLTTEHLNYCLGVIGQGVLRHYAQQEDMQDACTVLRDWMQGVPGAEDRFLQVWQAYSGYPMAG
ncbi:MAG: glycosyltransferase family A protein [Rubrivivax sp.]|nr:glycosyltransferase family A protein [Rubrivivax sp.]MDP3083017.1 glycosyltransferase family A protein [Rubrivivax sp.]